MFATAVDEDAVGMTSLETTPSTAVYFSAVRFVCKLVAAYPDRFQREDLVLEANNQAAAWSSSSSTSARSREANREGANYFFCQEEHLTIDMVPRW